MKKKTNYHKWREDYCYIVISLMDNPIEDGYNHPAENLMYKALTSDNESFLAWIEHIIKDSKDKSFVASIVKCFGRAIEENALLCEYQPVIDILKLALQDLDPEVREAAVDAIDMCETKQAIDLLRNHEEKELWLKSYINEIIKDYDEPL